jgi:tRNA(Ile)-lysidine synthase
VSGARLHLQVAAEVQRRGLWSPGDRVAVAVSGGRDSVCLLELLARTRGLHGASLVVSTIDHGTRPDSGEDVALVKALARRLGLACHVSRMALGPGASEATCRAARRAVWESLPVERVALGHHQRDQAETALLGMMRGGGTLGRAGMAWRSGRYVRPLLDTSPARLEAWAQAHGAQWREDPSNRSPQHLRNRVRHEVLPLLEELRPGAVEALARGAGHAAADAVFLEALVEANDPWDGSGWPRAWIVESAPILVRRALLLRLPGARSSHLDAVLDAARRGSGRVAVSEMVELVVDAARVRIVETAASRH